MRNSDQVNFSKYTKMVRHEETFEVRPMEGPGNAEYRFFLHADVGGVVKFCQLQRDSLYIGFVEYAMPTAVNDENTEHPFYFVVFAFEAGEPTIAVSNVFGFQSTKTNTLD